MLPGINYMLLNTNIKCLRKVKSCFIVCEFNYKLFNEISPFKLNIAIFYIGTNVKFVMRQRQCNVQNLRYTVEAEILTACVGHAISMRSI